MAYTFTNTPFTWTKTGVNPTAAEIALGLQGGMALPADFVNQQWTLTYLAIDELQSIISNGTVFNGIGNVVLNSEGVISIGTLPNQSSSDALMIGSGNNVTNGIAVGTSNTATGYNSSAQTYTGAMALGSSNTATGQGAIAAGTSNQADGNNSFAFGEGLTAYSGGTVVGQYNKTPAADRSDLFIVGNGVQGGAKSNALRVTATGAVMGTQAYTASGADYAEMFEWMDGNPEGEDRRGLFVTLDGEKIRLATDEDDYILGVISATPSVIGDARTDDWRGKYVTDVFGARVLENGSYKLSEAFEEERDTNYTSRLERAEWGIVGLVGKMVVVDDGTCQVNGYCRPSAGGVATATENGYRVMSRIDETHVKVLVK